MKPETRNALIAAALILAVFGLSAFYLPTLMLAVGSRSPLAAGVLAVLFVAAFFVILWLRGRYQQRRDRGQT